MKEERLTFGQLSNMMAKNPVGDLSKIEQGALQL